MENSFKKETKKKSNSSGGGKSIFTLFDETFSLEKTLQEGLPIHYVPYVLYIAFIGVLYIGNTHYADRISRNYDSLKKEVEDLRADYTTIKADYMFESKQSEVERKVARMGLEEGVVPPYKIETDPKSNN